MMKIGKKDKIKEEKSDIPKSNKISQPEIENTVNSSAEKTSAEKKDKKISGKIIIFFRKYKKQIKLTAMLAALIAILIFMYFTSLNVRFSIKEDLRIEISQRHLDFTINKDTPATIEIPVTVKTSRLCKASCIQTFTNINSGETEFTEQITFRRSSKIEFERTITPYIIGEGQDIYLYSVNCTNIATPNCPSENHIAKNIIITVTRTLTESESALKSRQENLLSDAYAELNDGMTKIDSSSRIISQLTYAKKDDLNQKLNEVKEQESSFSESLKNATDAWFTYNHSFTQQIIDADKIYFRSNEFKNNFAAFYEAASSRAYTHNLAVDLVYLHSRELSTSLNTLAKSNSFLAEYYDELNSELKEAQSLINYTARKLNSKDFEKYEDLFASLNGANYSINSFKNNYANYMQNNSALLHAKLDLLILEEDNCILLNETDCDLNFAEEITYYNHTQTYDIISSDVLNFCNNSENISDAKTTALRNAIINRINISQELLNEATNESNKYRLQKLNKHRAEMSSRNDSAAKEAVRILNEYISIIEFETGLTLDNITNTTNTEINKSLQIYFFPLNFTSSNFEGCTSAEIFSLQINLSYENTSRLNTTPIKIYNNQLPELLPRACFNAECKPYIENPSRNYPLIIVHGHGFYSKNAAVTPSEIHNELQNQLLAEKVYVPAGILRYNEPIIENSLSHVDVPFVYKATYYPKDILDNESIELFADRLNIIVENAKQETGKNKAILIAHSMGGLVTRAYLKKYSTDDIEFVIIGGTPNYGINSETVKLCKLFGRNLECDEMYEKSDFIDDLKHEPEYDIPIYTLRGEGCPTFGGDGDGIVQSKHVPLNYAENFAFNGTCSRTGAFHVNLLNPNVNPQIYAKLKEILMENK